MEQMDVILALQDKLSPGLDTASTKAEAFGEQVDAAAKTANSDLDTLDDSLRKIAGSLENLEGSTATAAENLEKMGNGTDSVGDVADAFGNLERTMNGVKDITGVIGEQFGVNLGPATEYAGVLAQVGGGAEALIAGGAGMVQSFQAIIPQMVPLIASTWAHVTALTAQAAAMIAANAPLLIIIGVIALVAAGVYLLITHWDSITAKVPILGAAFDGVKGAIEGFTSWITGTLVPAILGIWEQGLQPVLGFVASNWPEIATLLSGPFFPLVALATDAFGVRTALQNAITFMLSFVSGNWPEIATIISGPFFPLVALATDAFGVRSALESAFSAVLNFITGVMTDIGDGVNTGIETVKTYFRNLPQNIVDAMGDLGGLLYNAGVQVIQGLINGVSSMSGALNQKMQDMASSAIDAAKSGFGLWSPSREFYKIGILVSKGLELGIEDGIPPIEATISAAEQRIENILGHWNLEWSATLRALNDGYYAGTVAAETFLTALERAISTQHQLTNAAAEWGDRNYLNQSIWSSFGMHTTDVEQARLYGITDPRMGMGGWQQGHWWPGGGIQAGNRDAALAADVGTAAHSGLQQVVNFNGPINAMDRAAATQAGLKLANATRRYGLN